MCYNIDMIDTGKGALYTLYVRGIPDDFGGGYISYRCPRAIEEIDCGRYSKKHCSVQMWRFPLDRLPQVLLPVTQCDVDGCAVEWAAVYYALLRFQDKVGNFPVTVCGSNDDVMNALDSETNSVPTKCHDWYNAVLNVKWLGVAFRWVAEDVIERMLNSGH